MSGSNNEKSRRDIFNRALRELTKGGHVTCRDSRVFLKAEAFEDVSDED